MQIQFDHGTTLIHATSDFQKLYENINFAEKLNVELGVLWDPRVKQFRAPGFQYHKLIKFFSEINFNVSSIFKFDLNTPKNQNSWKPIARFNSIGRFIKSHR